MRTNQSRGRAFSQLVFRKARLILLLSLALGLALALLIPLRVSAHSPPETFCGANVCPMQVLFKLNKCGTQQEIRSVIEKFLRFSRAQSKDNSLKINQVGRGCLVLAHSSKLNVGQLLQFFAGFQGARAEKFRSLLKSYGLDEVRVDYVEPNFTIDFDAHEGPLPIKEPNDDYYSRNKLWGLNNKAFPGIDIDAIHAWDFSTGSDKIVVGVLDTGIFYDHPDLAANMWSAPGAFDVQLGGEMIHCEKGSHGFNALAANPTDKCLPKDNSGHGTLVSGIIGADGDNTIGVVGVNWRVKLMALKIGNITGSCISNAISAIDFALQVQEQFGSDADLRVFNASWGYLIGDGDCEIQSQALKDKVMEANEHDVLFVASAGQNNGNDNDVHPHYPSGFDLPNLLSVTAFEKNGALTIVQGNACNHGKKSVHLGAPGYGIWSTYTPPRDYYHGSLTSVAAPFVSGAAALMLSVPTCAQKHAPDLKSLIKDGTVPTPSMALTDTGGRLNVYRSINLCAK
jgi:subtilisin family serine protease